MIVRIVIWEPFAMAIVLGLLMSAGLYFAYLWPSVEPVDEDEEPKAENHPSTEPAPSDKESA
jgi:hypothetical protein